MLAQVCFIGYNRATYDAIYVRAMRDALAEMGMKGLRIERVE